MKCQSFLPRTQSRQWFALAAALTLSATALATPSGYSKSVAGQTLAHSTLWQAPVPATVAVVLTPVDAPDLAQSCDEYRMLVKRYAPMLSLPDQVPSVRKTLDQVRRQALPSQFPAQDFHVMFSLGHAIGYDLFTSQSRMQYAAIARDIATLDNAPSFTQAPNSFFLDPGSINGSKTVSTANDSLTQLSYTIGLTSLPLQFMGTGGVTYMFVRSKDIACDLIAGQASIVAKANATALLSISQQVALKELYTGISDVANLALQKYKTPKQRAAYLGYKLGLFYKKIPLLNEDGIVEALQDALERYFDSDTMGYSPLWVNSLGQMSLNFRSDTSPVPIELDLAVTTNK